MTEVRRLSQPADLPNLQSLRLLFQSYPFKKYQYAFQGVDSNRLAERHFQGLLSSREGGCCYGAFDRDERLTGFCRVFESIRHSEALKARFFRMLPLLCVRGEGSSLGPLVDLACSDLDADCVVETKIDGSDRETGAVLARLGFEQIGISVKLSARRRDLIEPSGEIPRLTIREAGTRDLAAVRGIVRKAHVVSHYFNQRRFDPEGVREMFGSWFERCLDGIAEKSLVAEMDGGIVGFVTLLVGRGMAEIVGSPVGVIDFVGVAPEVQGRGVGSALIAEGHRILERECGLFEIRTELDNYPAVRAYQRLGYRLTSSDQVWHRSL